MTFEIIPAIDLSAGRLGRLTARGPVSVEAFGGDPLAAAAAFVAAGVARLHVVDMDLALRGRADNLVVIASVVALGVPVQAAGGAASEAEVQALLDTGADRAVLGSAGLQDRDLVTGLAERLGSRLVIGVDTDGDRIRGRGRRNVDLPLAATLDWLVETAARRFVVTGLQRVGSLAGPDLEGVRAVVSRRRDVVAAGGIATPEDVRALRRAGAEGAIVGRAALEVLDLAALLVEGAGP
jgi:phosphoribosylformimino-5-aminoimidazole carboxamide ribonucleotide (ProFAR) isomerase